MKTYLVIGMVATINSGVLRLSPEQARARSYGLKELGKDTYEVLKPTQFKHGEVFGYDGQPNKLLMQDVTPVEKEPGTPKPAAKPAKKPAKNPLEGLSKRELLAKAEELGLSLDPKLKVADIATAIEAAEAEVAAKADA